MDSAQPEQALEPSAMNEPVDETDDLEANAEQEQGSSCDTTTYVRESSKRKFIPTWRGTTNKKNKVEKVLDDMMTGIHEIKNVLANDRTNELIDLMKAERERQTKRDEQFQKMMSRWMMMNANQTNQIFPPQTAQNIHQRFTFSKS